MPVERAECRHHRPQRLLGGGLSIVMPAQSEIAILPGTQPSEHVIQFYETVPFLLERVSEFFGSTVQGGGHGIAIASRDHLEGIASRLRVNGIDTDTAAASGHFLACAADEMLERISVGGIPDAMRFREVIGDFIERASHGGGSVRVYGEMASMLAVSGNHAAAVHLEGLWNELQRERNFSLLCTYPIDRYGTNGAEDWLVDTCALHSCVVPAESFSALPTEADRMQSVVALQQKALRLEAEVADRLATEERLMGALASEQMARREVQATKTLHDALLTDTAHDLRNPLTSLSLNAQLTLRQIERDRNVDLERVGRALRAITDQAVRMSRLLDRLLDVPHIDAPASAQGNDSRLD
jgi:hypothetical protein